MRISDWSSDVCSSDLLNHDTTDNAPRHLAALCQRCHMIHDADGHRRRRWLNAYRRRAVADLFAWFEARSHMANDGATRSTPMPTSTMPHNAHTTEITFVVAGCGGGKFARAGVLW